jgi:hypothetical protein
MDKLANRAPNLPTRSLLVVAFSFLTALGIWPALTNGQPFFYADTTAYVRGADLAISRAFGDRYATEWARDQRRSLQLQVPTPAAVPIVVEHRATRRVVLAGRSIIYGALLYLGEQFGGMWFSVLIQSLAATYLLFLFVVRTLTLNFRYFLACCAALFVLSPLPFFASFLMPDVFAAFLILGFAILATSWDRLSNLERTMTGAILLFAVLAHTTHLILLVGLSVLALGYAALFARTQLPNIRSLMAIAAACVAITFLWEFAFSFAVSKALGSAAVRPPFVTAKLVSMLGKPAVSIICQSNSFVVCRFQDRLPIDTEAFLWSEDENAGVFGVADPETKRLLGAEQWQFAMSIIPPNLGHFVAGISLDALRQLTHISLAEYSYHPAGLAFFRDRLPRQEFDILNASVAARSDVYVAYGYTVLNVAAVLGAMVTILFMAGIPRFEGDTGPLERAKTWRAAACILLSGIFLNAIICGGFSAVNNRYQARVIWLIQLCAISGVCVMVPNRNVNFAWKRRIEKHSTS